MHNHRLLTLLLITAYIFSPTLISWMINPNGAWYRPYIIWVMLIVAVFMYQQRTRRDDV